MKSMIGGRLLSWRWKDLGMDKKISIVIPNYNGRQVLEQCLQSIMVAGGMKEVVVVDDCSEDDSVDWLRSKYVDERVRVVASEKRRFFTGSCNLGAKKARGEWLVFLNNDVVVEPDWLEELETVMGENDKWLVQPKVMMIEDREKIDNLGGRYDIWGMGWGRKRGELREEGEERGKEEVDYVVGVALGIKRDFFWQLGGFDEWFKYYYEDVDLSLKARREGGRCWVVCGSRIYHRGSVTFEKEVTDKSWKFNVRKNRMMTVLDNFRGVERVGRMVMQVILSLGLVVEDMVRRRSSTTLRAGWVTGDAWLGRLFVQRRWWEVDKRVKGDLTWLDLGCGKGELVRLGRRKGVKIWGADKESKVKSEWIEEKAIEELEIKKRFEVVSMYHVLEHVDRPGQVLQRVKRWIRKGGWLVVEVPLVGNWSEAWLKEDYLAYADKNHKHFWRKNEIEELFAETGYQVVGRGRTWQQLPFHVVRASFKEGWVKGLAGVILWLPFKLAGI